MAAGFAGTMGGAAGGGAAAAGRATPRAASPRAKKALRFVRFFRPLALVIVRLEYAPRVGRP